MKLLISRLMLFSSLISSVILITYICTFSSIFLFHAQNMLMSETNNSLSSYDGHLCDDDNYIIRTSLKLHTFGRRFYIFRYWSSVSTISKYWQNLCCALKNQFVVFLFMCCIVSCKMMTVHASSSSG